jgi:XTP/dITP diphosphohydrolase
VQIVLSSRNPSKIQHIKEIFSGLNLKILSLEEAGIVGEGLENGATLADNASKNARFAQGAVGGWTMADDTGLFIPALKGAPGHLAARWAGEGASTEQIMEFTLSQMKHVPEDHRTAIFRTVVAIVLPNDNVRLFEGEVRGTILRMPRCPCQPKMPYSAIFQPDGSEKVWAEMTTEEENATSHRGIAFRKARDFLAAFLL